MEAIKSERHLLVLGWNQDGVLFLDQLMRRLPAEVPVVLVNQLPSEQMENLKAKYQGHEVSYGARFSFLPADAEKWILRFAA